jgi:hypothetical protein
MFDILIAISQLMLALFAIGGPMAFILLMLVLRDRKAEKILTIASKALNTRELHGLYAVKIQGGILQAEKVSVELWGCSREQMWEVISRLSAQLPRRVGLVINGISDPVTRAALKLDIQRKPVTAYPAACAL